MDVPSTISNVSFTSNPKRIRRFRIVTMKDTQIKLFKTLKFYMQLAGILELQLPIRFRKISVTFLQRICILGCLSISAIVSYHHCIFEANETLEFIETSYFALGFSLFIILYTVSLWKRNELIHMFDTIEMIILNRKLLIFPKLIVKIS